MKNRNPIYFLSVCLTGFLLSACATGPKSSEAESAEQSIANAKAMSDIALCRNEPRHFSITERETFLSDAIRALNRALPDVTKDQKPSVQKEIADLESLLNRAKNEDYFWNVETTCPARVYYPYATVKDEAGGTTEAFERAQNYLSIAYCTGERGRYTIPNRIEFMEVSMQIYKRLAEIKDSVGDRSGFERDRLAPLLVRAKSPDQTFWDQTTTCPAKPVTGPSL